MIIVDFQSNRWFCLSNSSLLYLLLLAYLGLVLFRDQWWFVVGKGKRAEDNGAELGTKERDGALFWQTMNMVKPHFRVQGRGEALVACCPRYSAMLSELRFTIVTPPEVTIERPWLRRQPGPVGLLPERQRHRWCRCRRCWAEVGRPQQEKDFEGPGAR